MHSHQIEIICNARRKGNLQVLWNIRREHYETSGDERKKNLNEYFRRTKKLLEIKLCSRGPIKEILPWAFPSCMKLGTILVMDEGRTQTNIPDDKKTNDDHLDRLYAARKEGGRGFSSIENSLDASLPGLYIKVYVKKKNAKKD